MSAESAYLAMKKRILPAVLAETHANGVALRNYCEQNGVNITTAPEAELVEILVRGVTQKFAQLEWKVKPAKLKLLDDKGIRKVSEAGKETDFATKVRKAAEAEANSKAEEAAQKSTLGIIASFRLESARKTEEFQIKLRARVARLQKFGKSWSYIEKDTRQKANELYQAAEREVEQVGVYRNLLSEVEV